MTKNIQIEDLGYDDFFESNRKRLGLDSFSVARVIVEYRGAYKVKNAGGEYLAKITGKQMYDASSREDYPAVGDWVAITELGAGQAVIRGLLPRKTVIKRKYGGKNETQIIASNIDEALVVESVNRDYNLNRFERYFAIAKDGGIKPVIVLNKIDLITREELGAKKAELKNRFGDIDIITTSILTEEGLDELRTRISGGRTYCFLGSSGVGKSSLINKLLGADVIRTEEISISVDRGKHVTTTREMYFLDNGGIVIDNPGMREVGVTNITEGLGTLFDDIAVLGQACKFVNCSHTQEPGCSVLALLRAGQLDKDKYSNYIRLKKEAEFYEMTEVEKRDKDRQFGKFIKTAKKQLKIYKK